MTTLAEDKNQKRITVGARVKFDHQGEQLGTVTAVDDPQRRITVKPDAGGECNLEAYTVEIVP